MRPVFRSQRRGPFYRKCGSVASRETVLRAAFLMDRIVATVHGPFRSGCRTQPQPGGKFAKMAGCIAGSPHAPATCGPAPAGGGGRDRPNAPSSGSAVLDTAPDGRDARALATRKLRYGRIAGDPGPMTLWARRGGLCDATVVLISGFVLGPACSAGTHDGPSAVCLVSPSLVAQSVLSKAAGPPCQQAIFMVRHRF